MHPLRLFRPSIIAAALVAAASSLTAAQQQPPRSGGPPAGAPPGGEIRGKLVAEGSAQAVVNGSIAVRRSGQQQFAGGTLPKADGTFIVDGLLPGTYSVRIRALGYAPVTKDSVIVSAERRAINLGTITMSQQAAKLAGTEVVAEADEVQLAPERNSYAVKNMTTASGGTAVDALRNVPSVEVDGSNKVSLRGNENVVVQINGRTSPLRGEQLGNFLAQLPANVVSRIEVATSPSAKDDPEGTAGIINLVLTEQVEHGLSGGVNLGTGTTGLVNASGNVGRQTDKWTLFSSLSAMRDERPFTGLSNRSNLAVTVPAFSNSQLKGAMSPMSGNVLLRSEYKLTQRDALSFDALVSRGHMGRDLNSYFTNLGTGLDTLGRFNQYTDATSRNMTQDYMTAFRRTGPPTAKTFSTEARFTLLNVGFENLRTSELIQADPSTGSIAAPSAMDGLHVRFPMFVVQADYVQPVAKGKFEAGVKGTDRNLNSTSDALMQNAATGVFEGRHTAIRYHEQIAAGYATVAQAIGKAQFQGGLRIEGTKTALNLPRSGQAFDNEYFSVFPNGTALYNVSPTRQLKASYSRRITRPDAPQLDPAQFNEDSRTAFRGNPSLQAEYTDAIEFGFQDARSWGSLQVNPYFRFTDNAIRNIRTVDSTGLMLSTFANVASMRTMGTDINATIRRGNASGTVGGGAFDYRSDAGALSTHTFVWNSRANLSYKFSNLLDGQIQANYRGPMKVEGGTMLPFFLTNFALRRKLFGESGSVTLRLADPFNTAKFSIRTADNRVIETMERRMGQRGVFVTFSRTFGQAIRLRPRAEVEASAGPAVGTP